MKNNNNRSGQSTKIVKEIVWPTFVLFINAKSEEKKGSKNYFVEEGSVEELIASHQYVGKCLPTERH